jgi:hypothetical protein
MSPLEKFPLNIKETIEELPPSEAQRLIKYLAKAYIQAEVDLITEQKTAYIQVRNKKDMSKFELVPLNSDWSEDIPEERFIIRGVAFSSHAMTLQEINDFNRDNSDIKIYQKGDFVWLERPFSLIGGATQESLLEALREFSLHQNILHKAFQNK